MAEVPYSTRVLNSGTTTVANGVTVTAVTSTRSAGARLMAPLLFAEVGNGSSFGWTFATFTINAFFLRTAVAHEAQLRIQNIDAVPHDCDWSVVEILP